MAKTFTAPFAQAPKCVTAVSSINAAGITTDSVSNSTLLLTAGGDGALVTRLIAMPRTTVGATAAYLFHSNNSGTTQRIIDSITVAAQSLANATTQSTAITSTAFTNISETTPLRLGAGESLYIGIGNTQPAGNGIVFSAQYTDF
jgi:hypothetical protein